MTDVREAEYVQYLANMDAESQESALTRARLLAANASPNYDDAPNLLSAEGLALRHAKRIEAAQAIVADTAQYADHPVRLADDDDNATAARQHVARTLAAEDSNGLSIPEAEGIVRAAVARYGGWRTRRTDLGQMMRDGVPEKVTVRGRTGLADSLVVRGEWGDFKGHPESVKSLVGLAVGYDYMLNGGSLVYLDWENGEEEVATRLLAIAAGFTEHLNAPPPDGMSPEELISKRLVYEYAAGTEPNWADCRDIASEYPDALWLWDSARGIIRSYGGDENSARDVGYFVDRLDEFVKREDVAAAVLFDHVTKDAGPTTKYGRGSGDKLGGAQFGWYFDVSVTPDMATVGELTARRTKGRSAILPGTVGIKVGDGAGLLPVVAGEPVAGPERTRKDAMLGYLKANHPDDFSIEQMYTAKDSRDQRIVSGTKDNIRRSADELANDPTQPVTRRIREIRSGDVEVYGFNPDAPDPPDV